MRKIKVVEYPPTEGEQDFYTVDEIEELLDADEISTEEAYFMMGYIAG